MEKEFDPLQLLLKDTKARIPYDAGFNSGYQEGLAEGKAFRQKEINNFLQHLDKRIERIQVEKIPTGVGRAHRLPATIAHEWYLGAHQDLRKMLKKDLSFIPLEDL